MKGWLWRYEALVLDRVVDAAAAAARRGPGASRLVKWRAEKGVERSKEISKRNRRHIMRDRMRYISHNRDK